MTKELTPLEALKEYTDIKNYYYRKAQGFRNTLRVFSEEENLLNIIENALKRNIELEKLNIKLMEENANLRERPLDFYTDVEKHLKALEIIKNMFDWEVMLPSYEYLFENNKEKYDLLKEVLL